MKDTGEAAPATRQQAGGWPRVKALFLAALDRPPAARAAFLDGACAGDAALRQRVEALLAADRITDSPLETPAAELALRLIHQPAETSAIGRRIGAYRVIRRLGHGGMGAVYLAVRDDGEYRDQVAIKLIRAGLDSAAILRRFRQERQILANLKHPNIARLLDGGASRDDAPYFVMEHIEGEPIDRYCDAHRLTLNARVELSCTVCRAVQVAHRNLVVHCDLKPSNILVTSEGIPKLLDFGVARLLDPERGAEAGSTVTGRLMTPEYASPEQIRGAPVTTASDVYSLGVVLYELLIGRSPYGADGRNRYALEHEVCERQPPRPSAALSAAAADAEASRLAAGARARRTSLEGWRRRVKGDLDGIVDKALAKDPEHRYGSAEELAEDLRRHLAGLPVLARQPTFAYRSVKFLRRHRLGVAAGAMILLSLLGGIAATMHQARIAQQRGMTAERTLAYLVELFENADLDKNPGGQAMLSDVLDASSGKIRNELRDEPLAQATLMDTIGQVYRRLGRFAEAQPLLEEALAIRRRELPQEHVDSAASLAHLGILYGRQSRVSEGLALLRQALAMRRRLLTGDHPAIAENLHQLGLVNKIAGRFADAAVHYDEALAMRRRLFGDEHPAVAQTLNNLGVVHLEQGELEASERVFSEALELRRRLLGEMDWRLSSTLSNLGTVYRRKGDGAAAEDAFRQALALQRQLLGEHRTVAMTLNNLGLVLMDRGDLEASADALQEGRRMLMALLGEQHPETAMLSGNYGLLLWRRGEHGAAERLLRAAFAVHRDRLDELHPWVATSARYLARALRARGALVEAEGLLRDALAWTRGAPRPRPDRLADLLRDLGQLLVERGEPAAAEPLLRESLGLRRTAGRRPAVIAEAQGELGACLAAQGRFAEAEPLLEESLAALVEEHGRGSASADAAQERLDALHRARGPA